MIIRTVCKKKYKNKSFSFWCLSVLFCYFRPI